MRIDCPTCGYEFETTTGLQCPRCGESISCSTVGCDECEACSNPLSRLKTRIADRVSLGEGAGSEETETETETET